MRSKKIIPPLIACLAVTAFVASSAQAAWTVIGGSVPATVALEKTGTVNLKLTSTLLGTPIELTAEHVACSGTCTINETPTADHSEGVAVFTGVTAMKPSSCSVANTGGTAGTVQTNLLTDMVEMVTVSGSTNTFDKYFPENEENVITEIEFRGTKCPLDEDCAPVKGFVYGETEATGTSLVSQPARLNAHSDSISGLTFAGNAASFSGEVLNRLNGTNSGKAFSAS